MADLDEELWKLGVNAKTEHNEVAPCQHEMAPVFATANIATDHNQLTMEMMKKVADRHGLVCLLHEKPFEGVNGSGKHQQLVDFHRQGENLLDPGSTPMENAQFLLFLTAVIKAVDEYQDLLRISVATRGQRSPPGRERSAARHRLHVCRRRAGRRHSSRWWRARITRRRGTRAWISA